MRYLTISILTFIFSMQAVSQTLTYPIVHTGVSDFYDAVKIITAPSESEYIYWQDAARVINQPDYTDNGDGTITDNITDLMWQQDMGEKMNYLDAVDKANSLSLGGYTDWRIPTIKELYSLILFTGKVKGQYSIDLFIDTNYFKQQLGDVSIGEREIDGQTWSSTHYTGLTMNADTTVFGVNFIDGRIKGYPKYKPMGNTPNTMYFRMVRGNIEYGVNNFQDNNNGTISDQTTNLMWQKADDGIERNWLEAIEYCEELELAGYTDWHLPNAKELQSLVDYSRSPMATQSPAIDPVFDVTEINDPDGNSGHYPFFWTSSTHQDGVNPYSSAVYIAFGKALGKMNNNLLDVHGAGAQRSDPKVEEDGKTYPLYRGPQGDLVFVNNHCRCLRNIENSTSIIESNDIPRIIIFPNPSSDFIKINSEEPCDINIFNSIGNKVLSKQIQNNTELININNLISGTYIIQIRNNTSSTTQKFIKE